MSISLAVEAGIDMGLQLRENRGLTVRRDSPAWEIGLQEILPFFPRKEFFTQEMEAQLAEIAFGAMPAWGERRAIIVDIAELFLFWKDEEVVWLAVSMGKSGLMESRQCPCGDCIELLSPGGVFPGLLEQFCQL